MSFSRISRMYFSHLRTLLSPRTRPHERLPDLILAQNGKEPYTVCSGYKRSCHLALKMWLVMKDAVQTFCHTQIGESQFKPLVFWKKTTSQLVKNYILFEKYFFCAVGPWWTLRIYHGTPSDHESGSIMVWVLYRLGTKWIR